MQVPEDLSKGFKISHDSSICLYGKSCSGKSTWITELILNRDHLIDARIDDVLYCYKTPCSTFERLHEDKQLRIKNYSGLPTLEEIELYRRKINYRPFIFICDDLGSFLEDNKKASSLILDFINIYNRKYKVLLLVTLHELFQKSSFSRQIRNGCCYIALFSNKNNRTQIYNFSLQLFANANLARTFREEFDRLMINSRFGYMLLSFSLAEAGKFRIYYDIFKKESPDVGVILLK